MLQRPEISASHPARIFALVLDVSRLCLQGGGVSVNSGTVTIMSSLIFGNAAAPTVCTHVQKVSISLFGDSRFARCLQGGGVYVEGGTVAISWCTISGNTAYDTVRAHL